MNEQELEIISSSTRNEKIKNFIKKKSRLIIIVFSIIVLLISAYLFFDNRNKIKREEVSNQYNKLTIYPNNIDDNTKLKMK